MGVNKMLIQLLLLTSLVSVSQAQSYLGILNRFCPCQSKTTCRQRLGNSMFEDLTILIERQSVPGCSAFTIRCCRPDHLLIKLRNVNKVFNLKPKEKNPKELLGPTSVVQCVPINDCAQENVYGVQLAHFIHFGFINPQSSRCYGDHDNILCVEASPPPPTITTTTTTTTTTTASTTLMLPVFYPLPTPTPFKPFTTAIYTRPVMLTTSPLVVTVKPSTGWPWLTTRFPISSPAPPSITRPTTLRPTTSLSTRPPTTITTPSTRPPTTITTPSTRPHTTTTTLSTRPPTTTTTLSTRPPTTITTPSTRPPTTTTTLSTRPPTTITTPSTRPPTTTTTPSTRPHTITTTLSTRPPTTTASTRPSPSPILWTTTTWRTTASTATVTTPTTTTTTTVTKTTRPTTTTTTGTTTITKTTTTATSTTTTIAMTTTTTETFTSTIILKPTRPTVGVVSSTTSPTSTARPTSSSTTVTTATASTSTVFSYIRVECVPVVACPKKNIYGTDPLHFSTFGLISPSGRRCFSSAGNILCIVGQVEPATPPPSSSAIPVIGHETVGCLPRPECPDDKVYGGDPGHFVAFGFLSPQGLSCHLSQGNVLCVVELSTATVDVSTEITASPVTATTNATTSSSIVTTHTTIMTTSPPVRSVKCVRISNCPIKNVYGVTVSDFDEFGFLSPSQLNCLPTEGNTLCIVTSGDASTTESPATPHLNPLVQCIPRNKCQSELVYGSDPEHFVQYGFISPISHNCLLSDGQVLCITASVEFNGTTTTTQLATTTGRPVTAQVLCVPRDECPAAQIYGTDPIHFQLFGFQGPAEFKCSIQKKNVLCVLKIKDSKSRNIPLHASQNIGRGIECIERRYCLQKNVYGVRDSHYKTFGYVSGFDRGCFPEDGNVLCTVYKPADNLGNFSEISGSEVQCLPMNSCGSKSYYGLKFSHFYKYGYIRPKDLNCDIDKRAVLCVVDRMIQNKFEHPKSNLTIVISCVHISYCPVEKRYIPNDHEYDGCLDESYTLCLVPIRKAPTATMDSFFKEASTNLTDVQCLPTLQCSHNNVISPLQIPGWQHRLTFLRPDLSPCLSSGFHAFCRSAPDNHPSQFQVHCVPENLCQRENKFGASPFHFLYFNMANISFGECESTGGGGKVLCVVAVTPEARQAISPVHHHVQCLPLHQCKPENIYGASVDHFERYGFLADKVSSCPVQSGNILCVQGEVDLTSLGKSDQPSTPPGEVKCRRIQNCESDRIYGSSVSHFDTYGIVNLFDLNCDFQMGNVICIEPIESDISSVVLRTSTLRTISNPFKFKRIYNRISNKPGRLFPPRVLTMEGRREHLSLQGNASTAISSPKSKSHWKNLQKHSGEIKVSDVAASGTVHIIGPRPVYITYNNLQASSVENRKLPVLTTSKLKNKVNSEFSGSERRENAQVLNNFLGAIQNSLGDIISAWKS